MLCVMPFFIHNAITDACGEGTVFNDIHA